MEFRLDKAGGGFKVVVEDDAGKLVEVSRVLPAKEARALRNAARSENVACLADVGREPAVKTPSESASKPKRKAAPKKRSK